MLLITNFSGFRLGAVAGGLDGLFYYKIRINDLLITFFDLSKRLSISPTPARLRPGDLLITFPPITFSVYLLEGYRRPGSCRLSYNLSGRKLQMLLIAMLFLAAKRDLT